MTQAHVRSVQRAEESIVDGPFGVLDAETANLLGTYVSEKAALRVVAEIAQRYGESSPAAVSLVLYRNDVAEEGSVIAEGRDLVRRALELETNSQRVLPRSNGEDPGASGRPGRPSNRAAANQRRQH